MTAPVSGGGTRERLAILLDGHILDPWLMKCSCGVNCGRPGTPRHAAHLAELLESIADERAAEALEGLASAADAVPAGPVTSAQIRAEAAMYHAAAALRAASRGEAECSRVRLDGAPAEQRDWCVTHGRNFYDCDPASRGETDL